MTPKELLAEVQAKVSVLAGIRLSDLHEEDTRGEGGGGDPDGEWHFIGLKGAGLIVSAYYVELKEHKSKAYATSGMGGNVTAKAKRGTGLSQYPGISHLLVIPSHIMNIVLFELVSCEQTKAALLAANSLSSHSFLSFPKGVSFD